MIREIRFGLGAMKVITARTNPGANNGANKSNETFNVFEDALWARREHFSRREVVLGRRQTCAQELRAMRLSLSFRLGQATVLHH